MKLSIFHLKSNASAGHTDIILFVIAFLLSLFGILMVYDASVAIALRDFSNQYYYIVEQIKWLILAWIACFIVMRINYTTWRSLAIPFLFVTMLLLLMVFIPGIGVKALGARRWINFRFFVIQPAELAKLALIIYLAAWFSHKETNRLAAFLLLVGMIVGLVVLEPDLGTASIIICIALVMYFISGAPVWHFLGLIPAIFGLILLLAIVSPYRFARLTSFLHPERDPQGASYQIRQATLALGSGGLFGVGLGKSRQKYEYLPEANTDSIFAIIGEETGFIGSSACIAAFLALIWRGVRIAKKCKDTYGKLIAIGITFWLGIQAGMNIAAISALIPFTGIPLPFISYGGSNLIVAFAGVGILLNISRHV